MKDDFACPCLVGVKEGVSQARTRGDWVSSETICYSFIIRVEFHFQQFWRGTISVKVYN